MNRLVTIPFSHFCEKARWALEHHGVPFVEEAHLPGLHRRATRRVGGGSVPVLVLDAGRVITDSTDILRYADEVGGGAALWPAGLAADVSALEERFDDVIGPAARRLAYASIFSDHAMLRRLLGGARAAPAVERGLAVALLPFLRVMLRRRIRLTPDAIERARDRVRAVFADVEARLADGRPSLCGEQFTAADLTFAALAAPLVMPDASAATVSGVDGNAIYRAEVNAWRGTRAGAFVMDVYRRARRASP